MNPIEARMYLDAIRTARPSLQEVAAQQRPASIRDVIEAQRRLEMRYRKQEPRRR